MKKRNAAMILAGALLAMTLCGCGKVDREAQESYRLQGIEELEAGDYEAAVESFQSALDESLGKIGDEEIDICYYKALAQYKSGDADAAVETYTALIEYDEENADAYFLRGSVYLADGQNKNCISDYDEAAALNPADYDLYINIYENLKEAGYEEKGLSYLETALGQECEEADEYAGQGYIEYLLGDSVTAKSDLATAVEMGSEQAVLYQVEVEAALGETEEAGALLSEYIEEHPDDADALSQAGVLFAGQEDYDLAITAFEQALAIEGQEDNQELRLNLIYAYEYSGDFDTAYELMLEYTEDFPDDDSVEKELTFLETRTQDAESEEESEDAGGEDSGSGEESDEAEESSEEGTDSVSETEEGSEDSGESEAE